MSTVPYALTTSTRVINGLDNYQSGDGFDDFIDDLIDEITDEIENYCDGRRFKKTTHTEKYDGSDEYGEPRTRIMVKNPPIKTLTHVKEEQPDDTFSDVDSDNYVADEDAGIIRLIDRQSAHAPSFDAGYDNLEVKYDGGYNIDFSNDTDESKHDLPRDLTKACEKLVRMEFLNRDEVGREQVGTGGDDITLIKQAWPRDVKQILDSYKLNDVMV